MRFAQDFSLVAELIYLPSIWAANLT